MCGDGGGEGGGGESSSPNLGGGRSTATEACQDAFEAGGSAVGAKLGEASKVPGASYFGAALGAVAGGAVGDVVCDVVEPVSNAVDNIRSMSNTHHQPPTPEQWMSECPY